MILDEAASDPHRLSGKTDVSLRHSPELGVGEGSQIDGDPIPQANGALGPAQVTNGSPAPEGKPMKVV